MDKINQEFPRDKVNFPIRKFYISSSCVSTHNQLQLYHTANTCYYLFISRLLSHPTTWNKFSPYESWMSFIVDINIPMDQWEDIRNAKSSVNNIPLVEIVTTERVRLTDKLFVELNKEWNILDYITY